MFFYRYDDSPSWGTQYTRSSSLLSKEEKDSWEDQDEGGGCSATDGGSMKLQLKVFSGSWWATENRIQTQKPRGQPEGFIPSYKNNKSAVIHSETCYRIWLMALWKIRFQLVLRSCGPLSSALTYLLCLLAGFHMLMRGGALVRMMM